MAKRKIILQQTVPQLGLVGDVVDVAKGFYRNYLAPRNLALIADPKSLRQLEHTKKIIESKKQKEKTGALNLKAKIENAAMTFTHASGAGDKLFGSITSQEIARALMAQGFPVDRKMIQMAAPLKNLGTHSVEVKLHPDVTALVKIEVLKKEEEKKEEPEPKEKREKKAKKAGAGKAEKTEKKEENVL